jgi:hypothetical protein
MLSPLPTQIGGYLWDYDIEKLLHFSLCCAG